jgi:hypothetical protein
VTDGGSRPPPGHHPDRRDEVFWLGRLEQEPAGPQLQRLEHIVVALEGGEDQHPGVVAGLGEDPSRGL